VNEFFIIGVGAYFLFNGIFWSTNFGISGCYCLKNPDTGVLYTLYSYDQYYSNKDYYDRNDDYEKYYYFISQLFTYNQEGRKDMEKNEIDYIVDYQLENMFEPCRTFKDEYYCPLSLSWTFVVLFIFDV
jgi:hypothetical protein